MKDNSYSSEYIHNLVKALESRKDSMENDAYLTLKWHADRLLASLPAKEKFCMVHFVCDQTTVTKFSMRITHEDANKLKAMTLEEDMASWILQQVPNYSTGLYDWIAGKEYVESTDIPYEIVIED